MMLEVKNLTFGWDQNVLLDDLICGIKSSEIVRLSGENGSGKSTFLQLISGMIPHFTRGEILSGDIVINEKSIIKNPPKVFFPGIAYIPGANINFFLLTDSLAHEILFVRSILQISRSRADSRLAEFCQFFPALKKIVDKPFTELLFNEKILIITFIFFLQEAQLFLFDEALAGFSDIEIDNWYSFFDLLKMNGKSIIFVDHHQDSRRSSQWLLTEKKITTA